MNHRLPSPAPVRIVQSTDADEHAAHLTNWEQCYDQTTAGHFHGLLEELQLPSMQVFRESTTQGMRQTCCVWPDALWFGLPHSAHSTRINGRVAAPHGIMVRPGGREFELVTPADYTIYGVVVRQSALHAAATRLGFQMDWERLGQTELVQAAPAYYQQCLHVLNTLLHTAPPESGPTEERVLEALLPLLDQSVAAAPASTSFARHQRIVAKARDYVLAHPDRTVTVPELCEQLFVSRRTLQYCFEDVLGINPVQYLRILRLNGARRHLRNNRQPAPTVRDVAADWGFWHFSQFSSDYRKLFGHSPSEALRQGLH